LIWNHADMVYLTILKILFHINIKKMRLELPATIFVVCVLVIITKRNTEIGVGIMPVR